MRLLLDTHVWIWYLSGHSDLSQQARRMIEDPGNEILLSPISIWETIVLAEKNRLSLRPDAESWVRNALQALPIQEAPLNTEIAIRSRLVSLPHQDPADRFLAATASVYDAYLLTRDSRLIASRSIRTRKA